MTDKDLAVESEQGVDEESVNEEAVDDQSTDGESGAEELSDEQRAVAKLKKAITVEQTDIGPLCVKLTVTIPRTHLDDRFGEEFAELKRDAQVPGFRKGHAPLRLVERRFASEVGNQIKGQLISNGYLAAVEKEDLKPLTDPLFWVTTQEDRVGENNVTQTVSVDKLLPFDKAVDDLAIPKDGPMTFTCEVELKPEFELPSLEGIAVTKPAATVPDENIESELRRMRLMQGSYVPVQDSAVEADDLMYADITMSADGTVIETEENVDIAARDIRLQGILLQGFGDAVVGKKVDDVVTFEVVAPDDHENLQIRGKKVSFEFIIREIKRLELPEATDEFAKSYGVDSLADLRDTIKGELQERLEATVKGDMREQIGAFLVENTELEIPEKLSERQTERSLARRGVELLYQGVPEQEVRKQIDEMRSKAKDQVSKDLTLHFILEKIASDRDVEVKEEVINAAIAQIAARSGKRFDRVRDELSKGDGMMSLYLQLRDERVLSDLLESAKITDATASK